MIGKLDANKILWFLVSFLSLIAAFIGVLNPGIYGNIDKMTTGN